MEIRVLSIYFNNFGTDLVRKTVYYWDLYIFVKKNKKKKIQNICFKVDAKKVYATFFVLISFLIIYIF